MTGMKTWNKWLLFVASLMSGLLSSRMSVEGLGALCGGLVAGLALGMILFVKSEVTQKTP